MLKPNRFSCSQKSGLSGTHLYIRVNQLTLNGNIGKYNLPHIWDGILINTPEHQFRHLQEHKEHLQVQPTSLAPTRTYIMKDKSYMPSDLVEVRQQVQ